MMNVRMATATKITTAGYTIAPITFAFSALPLLQEVGQPLEDHLQGPAGLAGLAPCSRTGLLNAFGCRAEGLGQGHGPALHVLDHVDERVA